MTNMEEDQVNEEARKLLEEHSNQPPCTNGICDNEQMQICQKQLNQQKLQQLQIQIGNTTLATTSAPSVCGGCRKPIYDRFFMKVDKMTWHEACVCCCVCNQPLIKFCYVRNGKMYCQQDYQRLQICKRCSESIRPNEYILPGPIHIGCFSCCTCSRSLKPGDQYFLSGSRITCHPCKLTKSRSRLEGELDTASDTDKTDDETFEASLGHPYSRQFQQYGLGTSVRSMALDIRSSPSGANRPMAGSSSSICTTVSAGDGKRSAGKRPRTILTTAQRRKFKASFEVSQKPCRKVRETLALETGLSPRVVQVWFQNQRAKIKKIARRQTQDEGNTSGQSHQSRNMKRRKKTNESDSENETSSPESYISLPATPHHGSLLLDTYRSPESLQTSPPASSDGGNVFFPNLHTQRMDYMYEECNHQLQMNLTTVQSSCTKPSIPSAPSHSDQTTVPYPHDMSHQQQSELQFPPTSRDSDIASFEYSGGQAVNSIVTSPIHQHQYYPPVHTPSSDNRFIAPLSHGPPLQPPPDDTPIDRLMYMQNNYFRT